MPPNIALKAAFSSYSATRSPGVDVPSSVAADDILIALIGCGGSSGDLTGTPPTGWAEFEPEVDVGTALTAGFFWKRSTDGSEGGTTITFTDIWAATETGKCICFAVRDGLASGDPFAGKATETTTTGTAKDTAALTPSVADCLAIGAMWHASSRTFTWDGGITEEYDQSGAGGTDGGSNPGWWVGSKLLSGSPNTSLGGDTTGNCATAEIIFFIKPESGTEYTDSGTILLGLLFSSTDAKESVDSATLPLALAFSSVEVYERYDSATIALALTPSASELLEAVDSGTITLTLTLSGVDILEGGGPQDYFDSGTISLIHTFSGTDAQESVDSNTIPVVLTFSGTDVQEHVDSNTIPVVLTWSGTNAQEYTDAATLEVGLDFTGSDTHEMVEPIGELPVVLTFSGTEQRESTDSDTLPVGLRFTGTDTAEYVDGGTIPVIITPTAVLGNDDAGTIPLYLTFTTTVEQYVFFDALLTATISRRWGGVIQARRWSGASTSKWSATLATRRWGGTLAPRHWLGNAIRRFTGTVGRS